MRHCQGTVLVTGPRSDRRAGAGPRHTVFTLDAAGNRCGYGFWAPSPRALDGHSVSSLTCRRQ